MVLNNEVSYSVASQNILKYMLLNSEKDPHIIATNFNFLQNDDKIFIEKIVEEVLKEYPNSIAKHHKLLALDMYARYTRYQYDNIEIKSGVYLNITELPDNFSGICKNVKSNDYFNSNVDFNDYIYNIYKLDLCKQKTLNK